MFSLPYLVVALTFAGPISIGCFFLDIFLPIPKKSPVDIQAYLNQVAALNQPPEIVIDQVDDHINEEPDVPVPVPGPSGAGNSARSAGSSGSGRATPGVPRADSRAQQLDLSWIQ